MKPRPTYGTMLPSGVEQAAEKLGITGIIGEERSSGAKALVHLIGIMRGLNPPPPSGVKPPRFLGP